MMSPHCPTAALGVVLPYLPCEIFKATFNRFFFLFFFFFFRFSLPSSNFSQLYSKLVKPSQFSQF